MTKEINRRVVEEVREVFSSINQEVTDGKELTRGLLDTLEHNVEDLINDYNATVATLNTCNSLVVKYEKYFEVIGSIEKSFVFDSSILDEAIDKLSVIDAKQK